MAGTIMDGGDLLGRQDEPLNLIGRLAPGVRPEAAKSPVLAWVRGFAPDAVGIVMSSRATTVPLTRDAFLTFLPLFTAFGLVLLIACANVSNMMLARALARQREVAIRVSLGAGRARLIRQLLTESVLLAVPAAVAGLAISEATIEGARRLLFATLPPAFARIMALADLAPDWRVFGFILLASVVTALLFGLAPAIQTTRSRLVEANRGDFSSDYRPARLRSLLVVAQVAVCTLLLISTAIVLRSERRMTTRNVGLETAGVWDLRMMERYQGKAAAKLSSSPGVETVAAAWHAPLYGWLRHIPVSPAGSSQSISAGYNFVSPGYFEIFRIPLVRGRIFSKEEAWSGAPVVVISEAAARKFWPRGEALGATIAIPPHPHQDPSRDRSPAYANARVIGVVRDAMSGSMGNGVDDSCLYFPTKFGDAGNDSVLVRLSGNPGDARRRLEDILAQVAPSLSDFINPMSDVLAVQIYPFMVTFWVAGFLGGVALLMTVTGIYGVMSYVVSQRRKEIGIRVALGAGTGDVVWMIVSQSARLAAIGTALGAGLALSIAPVFAHELEVIQPFEISCQLELSGELSQSPPPVVLMVVFSSASSSQLSF
jgi:predicted permease